MQESCGIDNIEVVSEPLPLGDVIIYDNDGIELTIIEKTLFDLAASIKDGRYAEQGYRLNNCQTHNHNIFCLVEGDLSRYNEKARLTANHCYHHCHFNVF